MSLDPYPDILAIPTPQRKDLRPFVDLIFNTCQEIQKRFNGPPYCTDQEAAEILYWSFINSPTDLWVRRFIDARTKAFKFWINPRIFWRTLATVQYTPAIEKVCKQLIPSFNPENYQLKTAAPPAPQNIAPLPAPKPKKKPKHKRGELWKLDARSDHIWPSSREVFAEILRRTQYPKRPDDWPWTQTGVRSLAKHTGLSERQVKRALHQLQRFGMIKRMFMGNTFQGASKYFVFLTPQMSGAFTHAAQTSKKHPQQKKRTSRIR